MRFAILTPAGLRPAFRAAWEWACNAASDSALMVSVTKKSRRSLEQNKKMWAMLRDIASQVQWPVNGQNEWLKDEEWKDILTAATQSEMRMAAGVNGGFVFLGVRTRNMTIAQMGELIEFMYAFGAERDVAWSEPDTRDYYEARAA